MKNGNLDDFRKFDLNLNGKEIKILFVVLRFVDQTYYVKLRGFDVLCQLWYTSIFCRLEYNYVPVHTLQEANFHWDFKFRYLANGKSAKFKFRLSLNF